MVGEDGADVGDDVHLVIALCRRGVTGLRVLRRVVVQAKRQELVLCKFFLPVAAVLVVPPQKHNIVPERVVQLRARFLGHRGVRVLLHANTGHGKGIILSGGYRLVEEHLVLQARRLSAVTVEGIMPIKHT
ncbi:Hypothetical predicted protein [Paramuricea clavata]|uniref:Uncharacterized protein n=1 Tax=Paramuricea clavata TaxID=317549 RepID=A0A6S7HE64_PARCT|nr:Hypothetical predicted protein [Paramuricea clavata]